MNFKKDLAFGESYEMELLKYIPYDTYNKPQGKFKDYDLEIKLNDKSTFYEVKADRMAYKTGNIAIEYECFDKPSGIETTKADYYTYFVLNNNDYDLYIIPVRKIKSKIRKELYKRIVKGGDYQKSKLYLFDLNKFKKYKSIKPFFST